MRKMMLAATLMLAACGAIKDMPADDDGFDQGSGEMDAGMGSSPDSGSGSGSDTNDPPTGCTTAMDCHPGYACVAPHTCVMGSLTIDPSSEIVVDGNRWWTQVSNPVVGGTFGFPSPTIKVSVGTNAPVTATLQGSTWSAQLPPGSIGAGDTWVTVEMTEPSGGRIEVMQLFSLDTQAPQIMLSPSMVRDERGDTIDFSTGEPVHTHAGADIDLAAACPSVYKYAYLMDATAPVFGSQTSPNPLAWKFTINDARLDPSKTFRVRTDANQMLINWTALPAADATGTYRLELTRAGGAFPIAQLGTRTGKFYVDVRARDWNGLETTVSWCFDNHPLAPPVEVAQVQPGELFSMSFASDSPFSKFLDFSGVRGAVAQQTIVQYAAEPVMLDWTVSKPVLQYSSMSFYDYVTDLQNAAFGCPVGTTDTRCQIVADPPHANPDLVTNTGAFTPDYIAELYDVTAGHVVATSTNNHVAWQIPARAATEAPHVYRATVYSSGWLQVRPPSLSLWSYDTISEYQTLGPTYTGVAPQSMGPAKCAVIQNTAIGRLCTQTKEHFKLSALDRVTLQFQPFDITVKTGSSSADLIAPAYVAAARLSSGQLAWDSSDDDLPGPR